MRTMTTGRVFLGGNGICRAVNQSNSFIPFFSVERLRTDRTVRLEIKFAEKLFTSFRSATKNENPS